MLFFVLIMHIKKYYFVMYNFLYEKLKNYSIQSFEEYLFVAFGLFCFLLLSNNTLHVMFYTYICYWSTFQHSYIIQINSHVVKRYHARVTSKDICLLFIILFLCLFPFCLEFVLFREVLVFLHCLIDLVYSYIWKFPIKYTFWSDVLYIALYILHFLNVYICI